MVLYGSDAEFNATTNVITFDRDIFSKSTNNVDKVNVLSRVLYAANTITLNDGKSGVVELYDINGTKVGKFNISGSLNLKGIVADGTYIVKVIIEGNVVSTLKVIVK